MRLFYPLFRRLNLGTKLTLSYTLVTVVPLLIVEIVALLVWGLLVLTFNVMPFATANAVNALALQTQPYFESTPPDTAGLKNWLTTNTVIGGQEATLWVVDAELNELAHRPESVPAFDITDVPGLEKLIEAASAGETDPAKLYAVSASGEVIAIAPIQDGNQQVAGYMILTAALPPTSELYQRLVTAMGPILISFTLVAGAAGTFFGFLTVRGLTRRLANLTQASDAWSRGDFSTQVNDASTDEIGRLARHLKRMAEQLDTLMQTRQALSVMDERNRLARDLHDSVKQQVFSIAMQLGAIRSLIEREPQTALDHLAEAERLSKQAQQELTALINELRPAALAGKGLAEALREHVAHWSRQNHIAADMRVQGERTLPLLHEQSLFRVAQEALANVARHSKATKVTVQLVYEKDASMLTIVDNGEGFDPEKTKRRGVGLSSMQERMAVIGGTLQLFSQPGGGTRIVAYCVKGQDV